MLHHVLGVLEDCEDRLWLTFAHAVAMADQEQARLTLAKTSDPGRIVRWLAPFVVGSLYLPGQTHTQVAAGHALARAAEFVPQQIPLSTLLLGGDTQRALQRLIRGGGYDAIVATAALLARCPRLARDLRRLGIRAVAVHPDLPHPKIEIGASS